ncbi:TPR-like protein [Ramaria rubella]|nr:TPR-like protein [Ramaria rubella]KAF8575186.1 TPR-like protein [Ramaria rubella]
MNTNYGPMPTLSSGPGRPRSSFSSSFSYGPQSLVNSIIASTRSGSPLHSSPNASTSGLPPGLDPNSSIFQASPRTKLEGQVVGGKRSARHPLAESRNLHSNAVSDQEGDDEEEEEEEEEEEAQEWTMVDRMRLWRHDALMQHLYETAAFWGDKVLSWTNNPNDAFWLAQTHFMTHQYSRAERLLTRPFPLSPPPDSPFPSHSYSQTHPAGPFSSTSSMSLTNGALHPHPTQRKSRKGRGKEPASTHAHSHSQSQPAVDPMRIPLQYPNIRHDQLTVLLTETGCIDGQGDMSRLVDMSIACRYLAAQCQVRQGKWADALEMLGESNPFKNSGRSGPTIPNRDGGIKIEASMCHLRGLLMLKLNRNDRAKECFLEALALDVKCYDAFEQLVGGELMRPEEEWEFVQGLAYKEQTPEDAQFVRLIYTIRLRKFRHLEEMSIARARLVDDFGLGDNVDVLFGFADTLYSQYRWADCYAVTSRILELVSVHAPTMPLHIACMHHLAYLHSKLFMLAHELVEKEPEAAISWYAVAVWYLTSRKWGEARKYFSKTSLMDPRFGPAWIAFGHTFAIEGEHDHAITAYSTSARLFQGSHLPLLYVGMEHLCLNNLSYAGEALGAAYQMCDSDPLLINELGVMAYHRREYTRACELFTTALEQAKIDQGSKHVWATTYVNLGSACRKTGRLGEAKCHYLKVLEIEPRHAPALAFLGMVHHLMDQVDQAIVRYHEALSIDPLNSHTLDLLNVALEATAEGLPFGGSVPGGEELWQKIMKEQAEANMKKKTVDEKEENPVPPNSVEGPAKTVMQDVAMADA